MSVFHYIISIYKINGVNKNLFHKIKQVLLLDIDLSINAFFKVKKIICEENTLIHIIPRKINKKILFLNTTPFLISYFYL